MRDVKIAGYVIFSVGAAILIFTFYCAYTFLYSGISGEEFTDIVQIFGQALAPLISAAIRVMFLGIMGWIGSVLTSRGLSLLKETEVSI